MLCEADSLQGQRAQHAVSPSDYQSLKETTQYNNATTTLLFHKGYLSPSMKNSLRSHACNNKVYGRWDEDTMDWEISMLKIFVCIINFSYCLIFVTEHTNKAEMD